MARVATAINDQFNRDFGRVSNFLARKIRLDFNYRIGYIELCIFVIMWRIRLVA